jgi:hypothetical protein
MHILLLADATNRLLDDARPQPAVSLDEAGRLRITFRGTGRRSGLFVQQPNPEVRGLKGRDALWLSSAGNLLSTIALQTAMAASGHSGLARCANCDDLYPPKRALPLNKLHFCPECGRRASRKLYMRRKRNPTEQKKYQTIRKNLPGRVEQ